MHDEVVLSYLEEVADKLEILVRDENINIEESSSTGGLCRVGEILNILIYTDGCRKLALPTTIFSVGHFRRSTCLVDNSVVNQRWLSTAFQINLLYKLLRQVT